MKVLRITRAIQERGIAYRVVGVHVYRVVCAGVKRSPESVGMGTEINHMKYIGIKNDLWML